MTTIALRINESTEAGKTLLSLINLFTAENKGVEVYEVPSFETIKAMYDAENKIGIIKAENTKDLLKKLRS
jgi:hypothetical protein